MEELKKTVKQVIEFSQSLSNLSVDDLINSWHEGKKEYIKLFGNKLIYEFPEKVSFELNRADKLRKLEDFAEWVRYTYCNEDLYDFITCMFDCFFSNNVDKDFTTISLIDPHTKEPLVIKKGTKIVKAFKYFVKDKEKLYTLQNKASQIIQEDKISGTLCLSVHPLDYLSCSENNHKWRSCHALDGEYRSGNLSYMVDNTTLVCYLKSDNDEKLAHFPSNVPWNSKKWRVLLFVSDDGSMFFLGRQYPFSSDAAIKFIADKLLTASGVLSNGWYCTPWTSETIHSVNLNNEQFYLDKEYIPVGGLLKSFNDIVKDGKGSLQFNDLLRSSCYSPMYCYTYQNSLEDSFFFHNNRRRRGYKNTIFIVGGKVKCLRCGCEDITNSETVLCDNCEELYGNLNNDFFGYCACCGRHMLISRGHWVEDELLCDDCYIENTDVCEDCGVSFYKDSLVYNEEVEGRICEYCDRVRRNGGF